MKDLLDRARAAREAGLISEAVTLYQKAGQIRDRTQQELPVQAELDWAYLRLINSDERVEARRSAEGVLARKPDRASEAAAQNILALAAIRSENWAEAKRILKADLSLSFAAVFNLAWVYLKEGDHLRAVQTIRPTVQGGRPFPEAEYLLVLILAQWSKTDASVRKEAMELARRLTERRTAFEFDAAVIRLWLASLDKTREADTKIFETVFNRDPGLLADLVPTHAIDPTAIAPSVLMEFCEDLRARRGTDETAAILAICQMREGDALAGLETIESVVSVRPKEARFLAAKAFGLELLGRDPEASSLIQISRQADPPSQLASILLAHRCLSGSNPGDQNSCSTQSWKISGEIETQPSAVLLVKAREHLSAGQAKEARELFTILSARHSNWRPLVGLLAVSK
jgi:tetratricopeptide (TPR) repeat protein